MAVAVVRPALDGAVLEDAGRHRGGRAGTAGGEQSACERQGHVEKGKVLRIVAEERVEVVFVVLQEHVSLLLQDGPGIHQAIDTSASSPGTSSG